MSIQYLENGVPGEREEVERKTLDTLQWLVDMKKDKQIDQSQYQFGMTVISQVAGGLISEEIIQAVWDEANGK